MNRAVYRNNDVTSQKREVTMCYVTFYVLWRILAIQASGFVYHGRGVNRVYNTQRKPTEWNRTEVNDGMIERAQQWLIGRVYSDG